jgi:chemosensory pili system protein ChpA (sensor histidine kinase/response regulator)
MSSYPSTAAVSDQFDTGPLSWVMEEIRAALARTSALALSSAGLDADAGAAALREAAKVLHQAHGALQVVDIAGTPLLTEAIEDLLTRAAGAALAPESRYTEAVAAACGALTEYLDELLAGAAPQALKLYPYYRDLQQARGISRIHPSDLYFPDLSIRPRLAEPAVQASAAEAAHLRQHFEKALLPLLKSTDPQAERAGAAGLADVLAEFVRRAPGHYGRPYWWVLHGFASGVASGEIGSANYVKQLFGRINMQLRKLDEPPSEVSELLMRDALYFIAAAPEPSPRLQQIRQVYGLAPVDEAALQTGLYGRVDRAATARALEHLQSAKAAWERVAAGEMQAAAEFQRDTAALAADASGQASASLDQVLAQLKRIAAGHTAAVPGPALALDVATTLLFLEGVLADGGRLNADADRTAAAMAARLGALASGETPPAPLQWPGSSAEDAGQRDTIAVLASEMRSNLAQVEKMLDEFFSNSAKRTVLAPVDGVLHQIEGALAILDQHPAMLAVRNVRAEVAGFSAPEFEGEPGRPEFQHVARNLGALSFFMESMQVDSEAASTHFSFDAASKLFVGVTARRGQVREVEVPPIPVAPAAGLAAAVASAPSDSAKHAAAAAQPALPGADVGADGHAVQKEQAVDPAPAGYEEERAQASADLPEHADYAAAAPSAVQPSDLVLAMDDEAVDAELLEIFLGEAVEVLETVSNALPSLRVAPAEQEYLTTLRRAFHTLKGSGRMVGLGAFGEAAWGMEKTLNLALAGHEPASEDLCKLIDRAHAELSAWVADLQHTGKSSRTPHALVHACEQVANGAGLPQMDMAGAAAMAGLAAAAPEQAEPEPALVNTAAMPPEAAADDIEELEAAPVAFGHEEADEPVGPADAAHIAEAVDLPQAPATLARVISFPEVHAADSKADDSIRHIGKLEISVPLHNIYLAETDDLVRLLTQDLAEWRHEAGRGVNTIAVHAAHSLAGSSATVGFVPLQEVAYALERVLQTLARKPVTLAPAEYDALDHAVGQLKEMLQKFAQGEMPDSAPDQVAILVQLREDVASRAASSQPEVQSAVPAFIPDEDEAIDGGAAEDADQAPAPSTADVPGAKTRPLAGFAAAAAAPVQAPVAAADAASSEPMPDAGRMPRDELDPDLLPVFLEEASDLLPQIQILLRAWQAEPAAQEPVEGLRRLLHTIKGSARMAGAMRLGQQMHDMESRIEQILIVGLPSATAFEDLLGRFDIGLYLYDQLQHPDAARLAPNVVNGSMASAVAPATAAARSPSQVSTPLVRVRADVIDRLVNQAGEVSISRSRVENGVAGLQQSLSELTENVARLRTQLRELEIQAETQISSQMAQSAERGFDPLEFDRFTRLQELSRMIAETVADVSTVQHNLTRGVEQASNDLLLQSRLTRDLQQDLMRVRMVQFGSIAERLYRVTRQAAKEVDKRVNLDIRGGSVEIDRGVLEKMAGPFEHLLRNAIVHGIESRSQRLAAGKKETGELTVEIRQEGNEVVIAFADDGQGLDLERIRQKAEAGGLARDAAALSDAELRELIFHPGFSTAHEVTELAGRGIGMDIVRSEASGLGGRIGMDSQRGRGTTFTVRLPLTLAVTQVVVLTTGGNTYAVPSVLVEQVQQLKAAALADAYAQGAVSWRGEQVPLYFLSELLGDSSVAPVTQQYSPLLILKSGDMRVAVHVDEVVGNREVVVKNIGPQLARMPGVAGATVLGSGDIVLILDPVPLAQRVIESERAAPREEQAPQAPRAQPIVMVVDDSLTVRRVTQRLLTREGYQVMLAKDGVDALEQLQTVTPHLMLVDIEMPRMDGFDLTRNVRDDMRTRHIPIIMITSRTATKHRNYAMELGVNGYLGKPYRETELLEFVAAYTRSEGSTAVS